MPIGPEMPLASFPRLRGAPTPAMFQRGNGGRSVTSKLD